jgi:putative PIN family toxin of toxin-antitoxin system
MRATSRLVVDTNIFVSAIILPLSVPRRAVEQSLAEGLLLFSEATMSELADVLLRKKLDHYASREKRQEFLNELANAAEFIPIVQVVRECRDSDDDKFLELALNGRADVIITGDADLLALHPWRGVKILTPGKYLKR